jgi:hypothetical integral membrane protein (TIGR02206 family)
VSLPDHFRPFSTLHLIAVAVALLFMAALVATGLVLRASGREPRFARAWAWSILTFQLAAGIWWLLPANYEPQRSIPLNLCRLVTFIAAAAFLLPYRWLRTLLFFWGLGLCTQALITPVFPEGPAYPVFWIFWIGHTQIVGSALYDLIVRRYRPGTRDFIFGLGSSIAYTLIIFKIDASTGLNYAGLGPTTFDAPNIAKRLGRWPRRVLWISLIAAAWLTLLWRIARPRKKNSDKPAVTEESGAESIKSPEAGAPSA